MNRRTVLYICHNHPSVRPGGAENYAYEVFEAFADSPRYRPVFLAKGGKPMGRSNRSHDGVYIAPVSDKPDDYFFYTDGYDYDWLLGTITDKDYYSTHLRKALQALAPDVVHLQHHMGLGYDALRLIRNTLPDAAIVLTLHEYLPICHRNGQMLRTYDNEPCSGATPRRCHECFPDISPQQFFYRKQFIQSHLSVVDTFISPSQFLADRFIDWGLPADRIVVEANGRTFLEDPAPITARAWHDRFAFFGQISPFKGVDVAIEAMALLNNGTDHDSSAAAQLARALSGAGRTEAEQPTGPRPHLTIHGANLELQEKPFQAKIADAVARSRTSVTMAGSYDWRRLGELMADVDWVVIPSIWYENSPLVIQEAFHHRRPVICSDIGGMAEKVRDGVDGLHFRAGDPRSLAQVIQRAASTPGLWSALSSQTGPVHDMNTHQEHLSAIYDDALAGRRNQRPSAVNVEVRRGA